MLEKIKSRIPNRPQIRNPFPIDPVGESAYNRVMLADPDKRDTVLNKMSPAAQESYRTHLRYVSNKRLVFQMTGIAFVGAAGTAIVVAFTGDDEDEDYDDEYDEDSEDDFDDEDDDTDEEDD